MRKGVDLPDTLGSIAPKKQQLALPTLALLLHPGALLTSHWVGSQVSKGKYFPRYPSSRGT